MHLMKYKLSQNNCPLYEQTGETGCNTALSADMRKPTEVDFGLSVSKQTSLLKQIFR